MYEDWLAWEACTVTCGGGLLSRSRNCNQDLTGNNTVCVALGGYLNEDAPCNEQLCPAYTVWSIWGRCDRTCGNGTMTRTRECDPDFVQRCTDEAKPKVETTGCTGDPCSRNFLLIFVFSLTKLLEFTLFIFLMAV